MIASPQTRSREALFGTVKRTTVAREGAEQGARRLLTVEEVTTLARRTQKFERYRACEADLQQELGRAPKDAEVAARLGLPGGAREYRARSSTYRRAKHKLVQSNLRLVYSVAGRFTNRGLAFQDLVQEGSLGMLRAAELFDPERGIKISTYATWWITQSIRRAIANGARDIRIPVHAQDDLRKMRTVRCPLGGGAAATAAAAAAAVPSHPAAAAPLPPAPHPPAQLTPNSRAPGAGARAALS